MNALFLITPAIGHYEGTFNVAKVFKDLNYEVYFTVNQSYTSFVKNKGFNFIEINSLPFGYNIDLFGVNDLNSYQKVFNSRIERDFYLNRKRDVLKVLNDLRPDILFIDVFNSTDFLLVYNFCKELRVKLFFIQTTLSYRFEFFKPFYNSFVSPNEKLEIIKQNLAKVIKSKLRAILDRIKFLGNDDNSMIYKIFKEEKIHHKFKISRVYPNGYLFDNITEFITNPSELEFVSKTKNQIYLGNLVDQLFEIKKNEQNKINIYVCFGTLTSHKNNIIIEFFTKLDSCLNKINNVKTIVSFGGNKHLKLKVEKLRFRNLDFQLNVNQKYILSKSDIFISHGGMNSIKEALVNQVPMFCLPLEGDQFGNAKKIEFYKLGLCSNLYDLNENEINRILEILISKNQFYRQEIRNFNTIKNNPKDILIKAIRNYEYLI